MRASFLLVFLVLLAGCLDTDAPVDPTQLAEIDLLEIEPTGEVHEEILVRVRTKAYNGCWSNMQVMLTQQNERHLLLAAYGNYVPTDVCAETVVREDTVIRFTPVRTGEYYFQANFQPFTILRDTVEVE